MYKKIATFILITMTSISLISCDLKEKIFDKKTDDYNIVEDAGIDKDLKKEVSGIMGKEFIGEWVASNNELIIFDKKSNVEIYDNINKEGSPKIGKWKLVESEYYKNIGINNVPEIEISIESETRNLVVGVYEKVCAELLDVNSNNILGIARTDENTKYKKVFDIADISNFPHIDKFETSKANVSEELK